MLSGKQPNHHVQAEARKCVKCSREMQKLRRKLEKLEGKEVTEKRLEMRRRVNGMRCETETVRLFCFSEAFSNPQICCFLSF